MEEVGLLFDGIQTTQEIVCTNCRKVGVVCNIDGWEAAESFQNKGWRATKSNIYCPECANAKLNPKKINKK